MSNTATEVQKKPAWIQRRAENEIDATTSDYIAFNKRRWSFREESSRKRVVLTSHFHFKQAIHSFSYLSNVLADMHDAVPRAYCLDEYLFDYLDQIYNSFGAPLALTFATGIEAIDAHKIRARLAFDGLKDRYDLVHLEIEGLQVGDLIYNWYCRKLFVPQVDLKDEFLYELIVQAYVIHSACITYLDTHEVVAVLPNHTFYVNCGILARLAIARGIPVYHPGRGYAPTRIPPYLNEAGWPENSKRIGPYFRYREIFSNLPIAQQERGIERGRAIIQERLQGVIDTKVLIHTSAWGERSSEPIFKPSSKKKIVIFAHDFCDNIHKFRRMLFTDFYHWLESLLEEAAKTDYDWYLKPHPNLMLEEKNILNRHKLGELALRFPKVTLLPSGLSNRQLLEEGIAAVFTVHGTAAHEYAYLGVPVVNAGDNLHRSYAFNLHPSTIEEFNQLVATAGDLQIPIDKREIEQFCYLHFCDQYRYLDGGMDDPKLEFLSYAKVRDLGDTPALFQHMMNHTDAYADAAVKSHLQTFFAAGRDFEARYLDSF